MLLTGFICRRFRLIQWSGEYPVGGSALLYSREEQHESIAIPGPLKSPLLLKVSPSGPTGTGGRRSEIEGIAGVGRPTRSTYTRPTVG